MKKRNTIQQYIVLDAVNRLQCHASADEIYQFITKEHPHISKGTVYRNLQKLADSGAIRSVEMPGCAERFDHLCHPHYHVKCDKCGRVFDVEMDYIPDLAQHIKDSHGFTFTGHDIVFRGICPDCGKNNSLSAVHE